MRTYLKFLLPRGGTVPLPHPLRVARVSSHEESFDEICEIAGCARGVLQKRLAQASAALRDAMGADGLSG